MSPQPGPAPRLARSPVPRLIVRLEGVVIQTLDAALLSALGGADAVDPKARALLRDLVSRLRSGGIDWTGLCTQAAALAGLGDGTALGEQVLGGLRVQPGIAELLASLDGILEVWLFSELAQELIAPAMERLALDKLVPQDRWLFSLVRVELAGRMGARPEDLLWVDDRPEVAAALIRAGANAAVFVDAFRLRRNLVLRGLAQ